MRAGDGMFKTRGTSYCRPAGPLTVDVTASLPSGPRKTRGTLKCSLGHSRHSKALLVLKRGKRAEKGQEAVLADVASQQGDAGASASRLFSC